MSQTNTYTIGSPGSQAIGLGLNLNLQPSWVSSLQITHHGTSQLLKLDEPVLIISIYLSICLIHSVSLGNINTMGEA